MCEYFLQCSLVVNVQNTEKFINQYFIKKICHSLITTELECIKLRAMIKGLEDSVVFFVLRL